MSNEIPHLPTRRSFLVASTVVAAAAQTLTAAPQTPGPRASEKQVQIGVVGGNFGTQFPWHLHPDCNVSAVCDINPTRVDNMMSVFRCNTKYNNFQDFIKHPGLDAVAIFTPVPMHAWMAVQAMRAGKNVISAVVAAMSEEQLVEMLETVHATGLKYMMAETSYFRPEIITCRQLSREGK